jgi:hypothetical protein
MRIARGRAGRDEYLAGPRLTRCTQPLTDAARRDHRGIDHAPRHGHLKLINCKSRAGQPQLFMCSATLRAALRTARIATNECSKIAVSAPMRILCCRSMARRPGGTAGVHGRCETVVPAHARIAAQHRRPTVRRQHMPGSGLSSACRRSLGTLNADRRALLAMGALVVV